MESVVVIGCGTMGHSITLNAAWAGFHVKMHGLNECMLTQARDSIAVKLNALSVHGVIDRDEQDEIEARIFTTTSIEGAAAEATFIIEAIPENIELKKELFHTLDRLCDKNTVFASNTSGLSPTDIASDIVHPERAIVTHFWNPAHLIPLVEIVPGEKTNERTIDRSMNLLEKMNKKPIKVNKEVPGFVGNRLQYALFREAQYLLEEGVASKEDIDTAVSYSIGRRLPVTGPLMTADMGGLDVFAAISDYLFQDLSKADSSLSTVRQLVEQEKLGEKTGEGFYQWSADFSKRMNEEREKELIYFLKQDI